MSESESTRGLDVNNPEDAKITLSQVNYYNLIYGYKAPFLDNTLIIKQKFKKKCLQNRDTY